MVLCVILCVVLWGSVWDTPCLGFPHSCLASPTLLPDASLRLVSGESSQGISGVCQKAHFGPTFRGSDTVGLS